MESKGVVFGKQHCKITKESTDVFSFTMHGNENDYDQTLRALLSLLGGSHEDWCNQGERYWVAELIKSMLPSVWQIEELKKLQEQK